MESEKDNILNRIVCQKGLQRSEKIQYNFCPLMRFIHNCRLRGRQVESTTDNADYNNLR